MHDGHFYCIENPLDVLPKAGQIRASHLTGFIPLINALGGDPIETLDRFGLDARAIASADMYIEGETLVGLLEYCSRHFDDGLFGIRLASRQGPDVFGSIAALSRAAATFGQALNCKVEYGRVVHAPQSGLEIVSDGEIAELRWPTRTGTGIVVANQIVYQAAFLNLKFLEMLGGDGFRPSYVILTTDTPKSDYEAIGEAFGCPFRPCKDVSAIGFPSRYLDNPLPSADRLVFSLIKGYFDRVRAAQRNGIVDRVVDYIAGDLSSGACSIERCAEKLGLPARTLQSHLAEVDASFSDLLLAKRMAAAKAYLAQREVSLNDIAYLLGYSEQGAFGRAFKRWTGKTPRRFRSALN